MYPCARMSEKFTQHFCVFEVKLIQQFSVFDVKIRVPTRHRKPGKLMEFEKNAKTHGKFMGKIFINKKNFVLHIFIESV